MHDQVTTYMNAHLSKGFNTQTALVSLIEKWKSILDKKRLLWGSADGPFKSL